MAEQARPARGRLRTMLEGTADLPSEHRLEFPWTRPLWVHRVTGRGQLMQCVWIYDHPVNGGVAAVPSQPLRIARRQADRTFPAAVRAPALGAASRPTAAHPARRKVQAAIGSDGLGGRTRFAAHRS